MTSHFIRCSALLFVWASTFQTLQAQNVLTVCGLESTPAQHHDLQAALDAAEAGDIVHVLPSPVALGDATLDKSLTILGTGHTHDATNGGLSRIGTLTLNNVSDVLIEGLTLNQVEMANETYAHHVTVRRNRFDGNGRFVNTAAGSFTPGSTDWLIEGNVFTPLIPPNSTPILGFTDNDTAVVIRNNYMDCYWPYQRVIHGSPADVTISHNVVYLRYGQPIASYVNQSPMLFHSNIFYYKEGSLPSDIAANCPECSFTNNLFYAEGGGILTDPADDPSSNIMNVDPGFEDYNEIEGVLVWSYDADLHLSSGSPAVGAGLNGQDMGLHGNLFDFNMEGKPTGLPVFTSFSKAYDIVPLGTPLEIEVTTETAE